MTWSRVLSSDSFISPPSAAGFSLLGIAQWDRWRSSSTCRAARRSAEAARHSTDPMPAEAR
jgi:hypothetical protein